jgi:hypothetical protein
MKRMSIITLLALCALFMGVWAERVQAQDEPRGDIHGLVYEDVNGNGQCINTGVPGEGPVEGINVEFISSDGQTIITHYSGEGGVFGLFGAGYSYWEVRARPGPDWVVTSENPRYAPIYADSLTQTGVNFCVRRASQVPIILPVSGQGNMGWLTAVAALIGLGFIGTGLVLNGRRNQPIGHRL